MLTSHKVQDDIIAMLANSELANEISGKIYREGYRPRDSRSEDIVVLFVNGIPGQIEQGAVTLNIFVPDITPYNNGVYVEDGLRVARIEMLAAEWVKSLAAWHSNYRITLLRTISTEHDEAAHEHFVAVQLEYVYKG